MTNELEQLKVERDRFISLSSTDLASEVDTSFANEDWGELEKISEEITARLETARDEFIVYFELWNRLHLMELRKKNGTE